MKWGEESLEQKMRKKEYICITVYMHMFYLYVAFNSSKTAIHSRLDDKVIFEA
jgi:hypothetical protein